ncbi:MAG: hypothetical protein ABWW65_01730 [Thermoprotei archaeon]
MHHYIFEISVNDKSYLLKLREKLLEKKCVEKFSGDLGVYYANIVICNNVLIIVGFKSKYYIDIISVEKNIDELLNVITEIYPRNKIMIHYIIREV